MAKLRTIAGPATAPGTSPPGSFHGSDFVAPPRSTRRPWTATATSASPPTSRDGPEDHEIGLWYHDGKTLALTAQKGTDVLPTTYIQYNQFDLSPSLASGRVAFHADVFGPPPPTEEGAARQPGRVVIQSDSERYDAIISGRPARSRSSPARAGASLTPIT